MAEKEGFEPPVPGRGHRISNAARSTTPAPLLKFAQRIVRFFVWGFPFFYRIFIDGNDSHSCPLTKV